jgi:membrane protease YdiL (CAAX protease family)
MRPRTLLWNDAERRPRAGVRVALLTGATLLVVVGTSAGTSGIGGLVGWLAAAVGEAAARAVGAVLGVGLTGGAVALAVVVAGRYVDRRRLGDFGLRLDRDWWLDCGFGLVLGGALMTLVFLVELAAGWVDVTGRLQPRDGFAVRFAGLVAVFAVIGVYEELLLRGYLLTNAAEGLRGWLDERGAVLGAVALSSLVFGLGHVGNPNATPLSTAAIVLGGVMLATGYVLTGELGVPVGLHTTWNLFQGGVFGFPVSGLGVGASVVVTEQSGPALLTGGAFGPEAGAVGVCAMVLGTVAIAAWARWRTGDVGIHRSVTRPALRGGREADDDVDPARWEPAPTDRE